MICGCSTGLPAAENNEKRRNEVMAIVRIMNAIFIPKDLSRKGAKALGTVPDRVD